MGPHGCTGGSATRANFRRLPYPAALGVWPAVVLLLVFSWIELVYPTPAVPAHIACFAVGYSVLTWAGMVAVRPRDLDAAWRSLLGRLRHLRALRAGGSATRSAARIDLAAIRRRSSRRPERFSPSMTAFVLLLLSTVLYDGLLNTPGMDDPGECNRRASALPANSNLSR